MYDTQILYFNAMIFRLEHLSLAENTVKHIHSQDHKQEVNKYPLKLSTIYISSAYISSFLQI